MEFDDETARLADAVLAQTVPIFKTAGEVETHLATADEDLRLQKLPKPVAAAVQVLRARAAGPASQPCPKCGSVAPQKVAYLPRFSALPPVYSNTSPRTWPLPPPPPNLCTYGVCPDDEHLHVGCASCGFAAVAPVAGRSLGTPLEKAAQGPPDTRRSAWDWLLGETRR